MGPKRKDRDTDQPSSKTTNGRADPIQADHELFLQAFEKPTQIYRYLRTRHILSPIFLHRNLSYMKGRCTRINKNRSNFKVDSILESKTEKNQLNGAEPRFKFMTLTFLGFFDSKVADSEEPARVETRLMKIGHKKRKDVSSPIMQSIVGTTDVCVNPSDDTLQQIPAVSISTEDLCLRNGQQGNSYVLLLRVSAPSNSNSEPFSKRRRLSELSSSVTPTNPAEGVRMLDAELIVYDRHSRCLLIDGDYELVLQETNQSSAENRNPNALSNGTAEKSPRKGTASWNTSESSANIPTNLLDQGPTLKFRLQWSDDPISGLVDRPTPYVTAASPVTEKAATLEKNGKVNGSSTSSHEEGFCVRYQFLYHSSRRQQTEARNDMHCPWCSLSCLQLSSLLKHLRLCHQRFIFSHVVMDSGHARIDVSVNESYDGSYSGNPHDLIAQPLGLAGSSGGSAFGRQGPTRRSAITAMIVWRPHRLRAAGHDPLNLETDDPMELCETQRPFITGHNRLYHHVNTCLPIQAKELDVDSEDESDPEWLRIKTCMMIDEFTDVNEGEKELMKLWNLHVLKHNYVGDCQMPLGLQMFLDAHGLELLKRNLYRNFILHLCNLYDFGIIGPATVMRTISYFQQILQTSPEHQDLLKKSWLSQLLPSH